VVNRESKEISNKNLRLIFKGRERDIRLVLVNPSDPPDWTVRHKLTSLDAVANGRHSFTEVRRASEVPADKCVDIANPSVYGLPPPSLLDEHPGVSQGDFTCVGTNTASLED